MAKSNKLYYLISKFNAAALERAAVVIAQGEKDQDRRNYDFYGIQLTHRGFGDFPTQIYRVPPLTTATEVIGIERHLLKRQIQQDLPIPLPQISQITGVESYDGIRGIQLVGETDFKTFLEIFELETFSEVEDSIVKKLRFFS